MDWQNSVMVSIHLSPHKNLANENALFFKNRPIKLEFSRQQIINNF
jgi:hypothetical protein